MRIKKSIFILFVFGIPFLLGTGLVGYWYWTTRLEKKALLPTFGKVPEFSLTSEDNRNITHRDFLGKVSIVDFVFTQCGGACPMMSAKMSELQQVFSSDPRIQFISFSVDPETDSPSVLQEYANQYHAIQGKWIFLTGDKNQIYQLTKEGFHLGLDIEGNDAIIHSQKFVLVDHHRAIRGYYDSDDEEAMKNLLRDTKILSGKIYP